MDNKAALVQQVKEWQRQGDGHKQSWYNWIKKKDPSGTFDPNRHEAYLLEEFLTEAHSGNLEVTSSGPSGGKGWGGGGSSWGGGGGAGSWGGDSWGSGGGGGKGNMWDMFGMMQQMMAWATSKGMGKGMGMGDSGKGSGSSGGGNSTSKPGDWICPDCGNVNFSNRDTCNKCGKAGRTQQRLGMKPGDWICPNCGDLVFASKSACKMCATPKPADLDDFTKPQPAYAGGGGDFSGGGFGGFGGGCGGCGYGKSSNNQNMKPGDWFCPACGDLVFASRSACKMCGAPKPAGMDGGRYNPY